MKLYFHPISTYSQKVLIALAEKGIPCEKEVVELFDEAARAAYRKIYPLGKVPFLVLDDGWKIPESSIIIEYLDTHFNQGPKLIPADPDEGRKVRFRDRMSDLYMNESIGTLFFEPRKPADQQSSDAIERAKFRLDTMYGFLEQDFGKQTWAAGDSFSMADCALAPVLFMAKKFYPYDKYPNITAYADRVIARDSMQQCIQLAGPYLEKM